VVKDGLRVDLMMNGLLEARYSIALLLYFVTYGIFELPSNLVIRRIGSRYWLSFLILGWGACVLGMGFIKHWTVMAGLRLLLGAFEAGRKYWPSRVLIYLRWLTLLVLPGAIFMISSWYTTYEMARRITIFYMTSLITNAFGGIVRFLCHRPLRARADLRHSSHMHSHESTLVQGSTLKAGGGSSLSKDLRL